MKTMLPVLFTMLCFPFLSRAGGPQPPDLDFSADVQQGCHTLTASFSDDTFTDPGYQIVSYTWNFGDGTIIANSGDGYPTHTYTTPGIYDVTMSVVSANSWTGSITKTAFIIVGDDFSVDLGSDPSVCGSTVVNLDATTPNATYLWSNGSTMPAISTPGSGQFSVVVTRYGCVAKDTAIITRSTPLQAGFTHVSAGGCSPIKTDFTQTSTVCGGTIVSSAWDFGDDSTSTDANPSHDYLSPGTYTVRLIITKNDATTDTTTQSVVVTGTQTPVVDLGPDQVLCDGSTLTLIGGNPGDDVLWSTGEIDPDIVIFDGGLYTVEVTRNGCIGRDSIFITAKPELNLAFGFTKVGGCIPADYQFTDSSTACTGGIQGWSWDFGDFTSSTSQNPLHTFTAPGTYIVRLTVTAASGSTSSKTKKVTIAASMPTVDLGKDTVICFGQTVDFDAANPGALYTWSTGENTQVITASDDGEYSVIVDVGGCKAYDTVTVTTTPSVASKWGYDIASSCLPVSVTFSDSSTTACGETISSWKWDFGDGSTSTQQNPVHIYSTAGSYNVRLLVTTGSGNNSSKTKSLGIANTDFSIGLPDTLTVCKGGSITLDAAVPAAQYSWSPSATLSATDTQAVVATPTSDTKYIVAVTKCSITHSDSVWVKIDSIAKPVISQTGNKLASSPAATYQWYFQGTALTSAGSKEFNASNAGYYLVKVTNSNGCENQSDEYFFIPVSTEDKAAGGIRIKVSPNPAHGSFNIMFSGIPSKAAKVTVYDVLGKRLLVTNAQDHVNRVDVSKFLTGLYYVEIVINSERKIYPVVVQ